MPRGLDLAIDRISRALALRRQDAVRCYFVTGTGRCGTMLVSRLLSLGAGSLCDHERSIRYDKLKPAYLAGDTSINEEIDSLLAPEIRRRNLRGQSYGECSGLMYLVLPELYRRYGAQSRYVLLVRRAEDFARSALARGFFDPDHPKPLEHLRPAPDSEMGQRWAEASPWERCLWYWGVVNGLVYEFFQELPTDLWRIQPIESLDAKAARSLLDFLQIDGVSDEAIQELLGTRVNATPSGSDGGHVNPWSRSMDSVEAHLPPETERQRAYELWARPWMRRLYPGPGEPGVD